MTGHATAVCEVHDGACPDGHGDELWDVDGVVVCRPVADSHARVWRFRHDRTVRALDDGGWLAPRVRRVGGLADVRPGAPMELYQAYRDVLACGRRNGWLA